MRSVDYGTSWRESVYLVSLSTFFSKWINFTLENSLLKQQGRTIYIKLPYFFLNPLFVYSYIYLIRLFTSDKEVKSVNIDKAYIERCAILREHFLRLMIQGGCAELFLAQHPLPPLSFKSSSHS